MDNKAVLPLHGRHATNYPQILSEIEKPDFLVANVVKVPIYDTSICYKVSNRSEHLTAKNSQSHLTAHNSNTDNNDICVKVSGKNTFGWHTRVLFPVANLKKKG